MRSRRELLSGLALTVVPRTVLLPAPGPVQDDELKTWDLDYLADNTILTPIDRFFVRNHFKLPLLEATSWKLSISGRVGRPFDLSYRDLLDQPRRSLTVTLECAGNPVGGGAVSTATWAGISVRELLRRADLVPGVRFIRLIGSDRGIVGGPLKPAIAYMRSIPLETALSEDTILAFHMNGGPLSTEHGYPVRAIVPGRYGMDSVKWITGLEALDRNDLSYFMTERYVAARLVATGAERTAVGRVLVKSQITKPREGETLPVGSYMVRGAAWAGATGISKVEITVDAGKTWVAAQLVTNSPPYTWVLWQCPWTPQTSGEYTVIARATDAEGRTQPSSRDRLRFDQYENNSYHAVHCKVV